MAKIPDETKAELKNSGVKFNRNPMAETPINGDLLAIAKRAVGNAIEDDEPYTIRINFQNGRIVGPEEKPRLSVELLDGLASTSTFGLLTDMQVSFVEINSLAIEGFPPIDNGGSWVVRLKVENENITSVIVNPDFDEEDRRLIKKVLLRGFDNQIQM